MINEMIIPEDEYIKQLEGAVYELSKVVDEQNAKLLAFHAKLTNEEKKVKDLQYKLWLCQQFTLNNYTA
mgnify:CR=1 FL=1